jgi:hypothetical protein
MNAPSLMKFAFVSLSLGIAVSTAIVAGAFLYTRYGDAPREKSEVEKLESRIQTLEAEVDYLKRRDEYRNSLLTNSTVRAAIKWVQEEEHPEGASLSRTEALKLACEAAEKEGRILASYKEPRATFQRRARESTWWVSFEGKAPTYGNFFSVTVHDPSGATTVTGGL